MCGSKFVNRFNAPAQAGFTLVELVVTLILIGIVAAVSAPRFFDRETFDQYGFFHETISAVRYAQKLAVATGCSTRINITNTDYTLYQADPVAGVAACNTPPFATEVKDITDSARNFTRTAPSGIVFGPLAPYSIVFVPLGSATVNGASTDTTIAVGNRSFKVWATTGFVERL